MLSAVANRLPHLHKGLPSLLRHGLSDAFLKLAHMSMTRLELLPGSGSNPSSQRAFPASCAVKPDERATLSMTGVDTPANRLKLLDGKYPLSSKRVFPACRVLNALW